MRFACNVFYLVMLSDVGFSFVSLMRSTNKLKSLCASTDPGSRGAVITSDRYKEQAERLRKEAAELEVALREEARTKGLPEEMINKLVPLRKTTIEDTALEATKSVKSSKKDLLRELGSLPLGKPDLFAKKLANDPSIHLWNSFEPNLSSFDVSTGQVKNKLGFDSKDLKLDDIGYDYKVLLLSVLILSTATAFSGSMVGGSAGFLIGYFSALLPILLLGVGSIAPEIIGVIIKRINFTVDESVRVKFAKFQAAKFLSGYLLGLPLLRFYNDGIANVAEFYQVRADTKVGSKDAKDTMSAAAPGPNKVLQKDIAPYSVMCVAGGVAECLEFQKAAGFSSRDAAVLNEMMRTVEPAMNGQSALSHINWAMLQASTVLSKYKKELDLLTEAFKRGDSLEECIAIIEGAP